MSQEINNAYKSSAKLQFSSDELEKDYLSDSSNNGKNNSFYAFLTLGLMSLSFAYIEYFALAIQSTLAMQLFLAVSLVSFLNLLINYFFDSAPILRIRIIINVTLFMGVILLTLFTIQYRPYYAMEVILVIIWVALFSTYNFRISLLFNLLLMGAFVGVMQWSGESTIKVLLITGLLFSAVILGIFISFLWERMLRSLYLSKSLIDDFTERQEEWAYTLLEIESELKGEQDFNALLEKTLSYIGNVIRFESSVITSLEGQRFKPKPLKVEGKLFEDEEITIWGDDLMSKLEETRQSFNSNCFIIEKGFLGKKVKTFQHFRLDIPVFEGHNLVGIISLRRADLAFDALDMTSSLSIVAHAILVFNSVKPMSKSSLKQEIDQAKKNGSKIYSEDNVDLSLTDFSPDQNDAKRFLHSSPNLNIAPKAVQEAIKQKGDMAKKTTVLLSREKADKISVNLYRAAITDGTAISLSIMEIDNLSSIREKDGDQVAYRIFSDVAKLLFSKIDKDKHVIGRYGKNGFSILMPHIDMNAAERFTEKFRKYIETGKLKTIYGVRQVTISAGVAAMTDESSDYNAMLKRADMALFVAKKNGRNCVKVRL